MKIPPEVTPDRIEIRSVDGGWLIYLRYEWQEGEPDQYGRRKDCAGTQTFVAETAERMSAIVLEQSAGFAS